ncbi:MAG: hypothetical protein ACJ8CB_05850 [Ktedonobacteraceae bacterium]
MASSGARPADALAQTVPPGRAARGDRRLHRHSAIPRCSSEQESHVHHYWLVGVASIVLV